MFGFGDLDVLTASESGIERLRMLRDAKDFKKAMLEAKHELEIELDAARRCRRCAPPTARAGAAPPRAPAPAPAPAADPRDRHGRRGRRRARPPGRPARQGVITPEEFEAKKAELLGRL